MSEFEEDAKDFAGRMVEEESRSSADDQIAKLTEERDALVRVLRAVREELKAFCIDGSQAWYWLDDEHSQCPNLTKEVDEALRPYEMDARFLYTGIVVAAQSEAESNEKKTQSDK